MIIIMIIIMTSTKSKNALDISGHNLMRHMKYL